jgi:hypothetical protein
VWWTWRLPKRWALTCGIDDNTQVHIGTNIGLNNDATDFSLF